MERQPVSAVSLFTAAGAGLVLVLGVVAVIFGWVPRYFLVWCGVVAVVVILNLWAARGARHR